MIAAALLAAAAAAALPGQVERGRRLVQTMGCGDCHTPRKLERGVPVPDPARFLSGHPRGAPVPKDLPEGAGMAVGRGGTSFRLPFGVVYAANLTPDETGLAGWSEEMFVRALRSGRHMGGTGRPIYPPMPWSSLRKLSEADLKAIYAFLRALPAVRNDVPENEIRPPAESAFARVNSSMAAQ